MTLGLSDRIADEAAYERAVEHLHGRGVRLPTFAELADPRAMDSAAAQAAAAVGPDAADARNLFRVHWYNDTDGGVLETPRHLVLPPELTGVEAPIVVLLGDSFPMIRAHKVLAAYGCLVTRIVTGQFDPTRQRAVWPSTGNYCRGGVAISRILGCRCVAVLPEGMSRERFRWLESWVTDPSDIVRTVGTESNVKEIYDTCRELAREPDNVILNQFSEFGNYLAHHACTGPAVEAVLRAVQQDRPRATLAAFVAGTGSAGTLAAGDYLKARHHSHIVAVEPRECPTLLYNGYGEHNIQGIGDKHVPLIHNVFNTDMVAAVSDRASNALNAVFNTDAGRGLLTGRHGVDPDTAAGLGSLGLSGIANVLACVKVAKYHRLSASDVLVTVATDGAEMYASELQQELQARHGGRYGEVDAAEDYGRYLLACTYDDTRELTRPERERIFNLGYYTWVEQQGTALADFDARRSQAFWRDQAGVAGAVDAMISRFNAR